MAILEKLKAKLGPAKIPGASLPIPKQAQRFRESTLGTLLRGKPQDILSALRRDVKSVTLTFPTRDDFARLEAVETSPEERERLKDKLITSTMIFNVGSLAKVRPAAVVALEQVKQSPVVQKLLNVLKEAKPARKELAKLQSLERGRRAGAISGIFERETGEAAHFKALGKLKGELVPEERAPRFEGLRVGKEVTEAPNKITQQDADELVRNIQQHPVLDDIFEKIHATEGLRNIFEGKIPKPSQLILLEEVFGSDLIKGLMAKRPLGQKITDIIEDVINIPRSLMASFDASAHLRQGILFTTTRPKSAFKSSIGAFKETFSQKNFESWLTDLKLSPEFRLMKRSDLYIAEPNKLAGGLAAREERFMSSLVEKIPLIGPIVKASSRNYAAYLNKLRVDTFNTFSKEFIESGETFADNPQLFKDLANFINTATGRGNTGKFARMGPLMNGLFFSPKLIAARFNMLNPVWYAKQSPQVRKLAIKNFAKFVGIVSSFTGLVSQIDGVTVETDPRSTDFMKIRYKNTRWDPWGGFQQWVRMFTQMATGQRKTAKGEIIKLSKKKFPFETRLDVGARFFRGKLAPIPALTLELMEGQKMFGEKLKFGKEAVDKLTPLYLADMKEAIEEFGPSAIFVTGIPAFFGVGVQTYEEKSKAGNPFNI